MRRWLYPDKDYDEKCAAFLRLEVFKPNVVPGHGLALWLDTEGEMRTYCAIVYGLWKLGEGLNDLADALRGKGEAKV